MAEDTKIEVTMSESEIALEYAKRIATAMWQKHWKEDSPDFKTFDDLMGVLSQIDNMAAGMKRYTEACGGRCGSPDCDLDTEGARLP